MLHSSLTESLLTLVQPFHWLSFHILGPVCYSQLVDFHSFSRPCLWHTFAGVLSLQILILSTVLKVPQILRILQSKSVHGLSLTALVIDFIALTVGIIYHFRYGTPLLKFVEAISLWLQDLVILLLWNRSDIAHDPRLDRNYYQYLGTSIAVIAIYAALPVDRQQLLLPNSLLNSLMVTSVSAGLAGGGFQILENYRQSSTGQLSLMMCGLGVVCGMGRLATYLIEKKDVDKLVVLSNVLGALIGIALIFQIIYYRHVGPGTAEYTATMQEREQRPKTQSPSRLAATGRKRRKSH